MSYFVGRGEIQIATRTTALGAIPTVFSFIGNVADFSVEPGNGYARYASGCPKLIKGGTPPSFSMTVDELHPNALYQVLYGTKYTASSVTTMGLFVTHPAEYCWLRFSGINIADNGSAVVVDLMKVKLNLPDKLPLLSDDFLKFSLNGRVFNEERLMQSTFDIAKYGRLMKFTGVV